MNLVKYDDFWNDPLSDLDQWFEGALGPSRVLPSLFNQSADLGATRGFRLDSYADDENYYVVAELPGIPKDAINISVENAVLTISGEHKSGKGENERSVRFSRSVTLGDDVNADKAAANYEDGLLKITLPKSEASKPKAIAVK